MAEITNKPDDEAIVHQLEKVDQGGEIMDLFESRIELLAHAWGYEIELDVDSPHYGDIRLPDGRYAGLRFEAFITE